MYWIFNATSMVTDLLSQNAMNAAEITDKLGLHSLRQRAWVRYFLIPMSLLNKPLKLS